MEVSIVGTLTYFEKVDLDFESFPASYEARVWLPEEEVNQLLEAARLGKLPNPIDLELAGKGLKYGWEPDASGVDWANKSHSQLVVRRAAFNLPLAGAPTEDEEDDPAAPSLDDLPPTRRQAADLLKRVEDLVERVANLKTMVLSLGLIAIVVLIFN